MSESTENANRVWAEADAIEDAQRAERNEKATIEPAHRGQPVNTENKPSTLTGQREAVYDNRSQVGHDYHGAGHTGPNATTERVDDGYATAHHPRSNAGAVRGSKSNLKRD